MKPLRVAVISARKPPVVCGIGDYSHFLTEALRAAGHGVEHLASDERSWTLSSASRILGRLWETRFDLVSLQYEPFSFGQPFVWLEALRWVLRRQGSPLCLTAHELFHRHALDRARDERLYRGASAVIVHDHWHARLLENRGVRAHLAAVGSNIPLSARDVNPVVGRIGYFGFINGVKAVEELIESLPLVRARFPNAHLRFFGEISTAERARLDQLATRLGIADSFTILGALAPELVSREIRSCEFMVLPYTDGASLRRGSLVAALTHGACTITTSRKESPDPRLRHGENVHLIDRPERALIADALTELARQPELATRIRSGARALDLSWTALASTYQNVFASLCRETP